MILQHRKLTAALFLGLCAFIPTQAAAQKADHAKLKAHLVQVAKKLEHGIKSGKISFLEAMSKFKQVQAQIGVDARAMNKKKQVLSKKPVAAKSSAGSHEAQINKQLSAIVKKLNAEHAAGKISAEDAKAKWVAIQKKAREALANVKRQRALDQKANTKKANYSRQRADYAKRKAQATKKRQAGRADMKGLAKKLKAAVKAGKLSKKDAMAKWKAYSKKAAAMKKRSATKKRSAAKKPSPDRSAAQKKLQAMTTNIRAMVRAGKLSPEEARAKLLAFKKRLAAKSRATKKRY